MGVPAGRVDGATARLGWWRTRTVVPDGQAVDPDVVDEVDRHRQAHAPVQLVGGHLPAAVVGHRDLHDPRLGQLAVYGHGVRTAGPVDVGVFDGVRHDLADGVLDGGGGRVVDPESGQPRVERDAGGRHRDRGAGERQVHLPQRWVPLGREQRDVVPVPGAPDEQREDVVAEALCGGTPVEASPQVGGGVGEVVISLGRVDAGSFDDPVGVEQQEVAVRHPVLRLRVGGARRERTGGPGDVAGSGGGEQQRGRVPAELTRSEPVVGSSTATQTVAVCASSRSRAKRSNAVTTPAGDPPDSRQ